MPVLHLLIPVFGDPQRIKTTKDTRQNTGAGKLKIIRGTSTVDYRGTSMHLQHSPPPKGNGESARRLKATEATEATKATETTETTEERILVVL